MTFDLALTLSYLPGAGICYSMISYFAIQRGLDFSVLKIWT